MGGITMTSQILALFIFVLMFALVISEKIERHLVTLICAGLTILVVFGISMHSMEAISKTLNLKSIFTAGFWYTASEGGESSSGINWATIIFIAGMMVMVEGMAKAGFFRWLCISIAGLVNYKAVRIFVMFMLMSAFLAMFIDSITVILFLAAVTVELSQMLKFDPIPMILAEIFCANLGGSATMCGDPPNIIIGTSLGYSFADFITNTGVIAGIALIFVIIYFYIYFHKDFKKCENNDADISKYPKASSAITNKRGFAVSSVIFALAVILLVTHSMTGLTVATIGLFIAAITLITSGKYALELIKKLDYKTLLFFIGLFVVVGGLEQTGVLEIAAGLIGKICGGNIHLMIAIIIWISGVASAFIDNIPFAATMIPIIENLAAAQGVDLKMLAWSLSLGTDIGGSATPIGASANVVGMSVAAKEGYTVDWARYCKAMVAPTVIVLFISTISIWLKYV